MKLTINCSLLETVLNLVRQLWCWKITFHMPAAGVDIHKSLSSRSSKPPRKEELQSKPSAPVPHQPATSVHQAAEGRLIVCPNFKKIFHPSHQPPLSCCVWFFLFASSFSFQIFSLQTWINNPFRVSYFLMFFFFSLSIHH